MKGLKWLCVTICACALLLTACAPMAADTDPPPAPPAQAESDTAATAGSRPLTEDTGQGGEEIYDWLCEACGAPEDDLPAGYEVSFEAAARAFSGHLKENWSGFSKRPFPGEYEGAALSAEAYPYLDWTVSWRLTLLGADATGYKWSDTLYLNGDTGEIVSGASGPREN